MQEFYEKYKDSGVVSGGKPQINGEPGIDNSERAENRQGIYRTGGYTFPVLLIGTGRSGIYTCRGIPVTYMIDKEGIRYMKPGAFTGVEELEAFAKAQGGYIIVVSAQERGEQGMPSEDKGCLYCVQRPSEIWRYYPARPADIEGSRLYRR